MPGAPSDAESSSGDDNPRFRPLLSGPQDAEADAPAKAGPRARRPGPAPAARGNNRSFKAALQRIIDEGSSSDDNLPGLRRARKPEAPAKRKRKEKEPAAAASAAADDRAGKRGKPGAPAGKPERERAPKAPRRAPADPSEIVPTGSGQLLRRRLRSKGPTSHVQHEASPPTASRPQQDGADADSDGDNGGSARFRMRAAHGGGGGGGKRKNEADSGSEMDPDEEEVGLWSEELQRRADQLGRGILRTAFSMKECPGAKIRGLQPECFLGGRRLEDGGHPLFDDEGKANLHFLLSTFRAVQRERERRKRGKDEKKKEAGEDSEEEGPDNLAEVKYLRWLVRQARELKLVNKVELRRGMLSAKRMAAARKMGSFSLMLDCNLADISDSEAPQINADGKERPATRSEIAFAAKFPERKAAPQDGSGVNQERLRSRVVTRQTAVSVASSHDLDLEKVADLLTAPTLSFDWEDKDASDDEDGLEVALPDIARLKNSKRDVFKDQLKRSVSFNQAKSLSRSDTNQSLDQTFARLQSASLDLESEAAPADAEKPAPEEPAGEPQSGSAEGKAPAPAPKPSPAPAAPAPTPPAEKPAPAREARAPPQEEEAATTGAGAKGAAAKPADRKAAAEAPPSNAAPAAPAADPPLAEASVDISPTQMWGGADLMGWSRDSEGAEPRPTQAPPKAHGDQGPPEISPTMPFVPEDQCHAGISPTMPFVPEDQGPPEISPTMPFVPEVSSTQVGGADGADAVEAKTPQPASGEARVKDATDPPPSQRKLKRSASIMSDESLSDSNDDPEHGAELTASQVLTPEEEKRRRLEREWLRHKRRKLRVEEETARKRIRKDGPGAKTGSSLGSRAAPTAAADDDAALFGGMQSGANRRPKSFLMGGAAKVAAK